MRNYTSDSRLKEKYNKEQNMLISRRLKQIKATVNTKSPESYYYLKTVNIKNPHRSKGNISKL